MNNSISAEAGGDLWSERAVLAKNLEAGRRGVFDIIAGDSCCDGTGYIKFKSPISTVGHHYNSKSLKFFTLSSDFGDCSITSPNASRRTNSSCNVVVR